MISTSNHKRKVPYQLYITKKNREPDHLLQLIHKNQKNQQKENNDNELSDGDLMFKGKQSLNEKVQSTIRKHLIEKRVNNILNGNGAIVMGGNNLMRLNNGGRVSSVTGGGLKPSVVKVSEPVKCMQKVWVPPMKAEIEERKFTHEQLLMENKKKREKKLMQMEMENNGSSNSGSGMGNGLYRYHQNNSERYEQNRAEFRRMAAKVINLNNRLKYFGEYLQTDLDGLVMKSGFEGQGGKKWASVNGSNGGVFGGSVVLPKTRESKLDYLSARFKEISKKQKPKLFISNANTSSVSQNNSLSSSQEPLPPSVSLQNKYSNINNPLQYDEYYQKIIKKDISNNKKSLSEKVSPCTPTLTQMLIQALQHEKHFSLTSYTQFYDIFVWQMATKSELMDFVVRLLMGDRNQLEIMKISDRIDQICEKINLQDLSSGSGEGDQDDRAEGSGGNGNGALRGFNEIMKKLLFGEEYVFAMKNQYYLTREALRDSLEKNEECISIFINVFYV